MQLVDRICRVCHSNQSNEIFDQPTHTIVGIGDIDYHHKIRICQTCGFVFASPLLPEDKILLYYESMSNYEHPQFEGCRPQGEINQIIRYINFLKKRFPAGFKGRALDIGCANAYGLSLLKKEGWEVLGIDPSDKCIEFSKRIYGVKALKGFFNLNLLKKEKPFDLIILCHVLEHLIYPDQVIIELHQIVKDGGIIYIEVPNLMKPFAPKCYFSFEHVNYFTPISLANLMGLNGYAVDSLLTLDNGPEYSPFYPVIASTWRSSQTEYLSKNDYHQGTRVVETFKKNSDVLIVKLQRIIQDILKTYQPHRIALWGGGIHTSQLLSQTTLGKVDIACIFDNDPKKHGKILLGIPIIKFVDDIPELKKKIDAIIISSEASEDAIYFQISYLSKFGIKIYRLYEKDGTD